MNADQRLRNRIIREALRNRLAVQLDTKIAMREANYKQAQDKMIDRRQALIEVAKNEERESLRPQFARIVAEMEEASLMVSTTKIALSTEIKAAQAAGMSLKLSAEKQKLLNASKLKVLAASKAY